MKKLIATTAVLAALIPVAGFADTYNPCVQNADIQNNIEVGYVVTNLSGSQKSAVHYQVFSHDAAGACQTFTPNTSGVDNPFYFYINDVKMGGQDFPIHRNSVGSLIATGAATVTPKIKGGSGYPYKVIGYTVTYGDGLSANK